MKMVDLTRPPTVKERAKLEARVSRLDRPERVSWIDRIYEAMPGSLPGAGLILRSGFSYRESGLDAEASDRRAPAAEFRPPATRLITSRGQALRFALTLVALVQSNRGPGARARLKDFGIEVAGSSSVLGWSDLIASDSVGSNRGGVYVSARDKRARSVRQALLALEVAGIVSLPKGPGGRNQFEDFVLFSEIGLDAVGEREEYRVPEPGLGLFAMPPGFIVNGWLHVLEDSEIALLLMVACRKGGWGEGRMLVMPSDIRLLRYGIHRDAYSAARKTLEWAGLLRVEEVDRHPDGKAERAAFQVHRLGLVESGFEANAPRKFVEVIKQQINRA